MSSDASDNLLLLCAMGWGLLIVAAFVKVVYSCIRKMCYGDEGRRVSDEDEESGEFYRSMSPGRQEEIDNLRKIALLRYLSRFTLTLNEEHLRCCAGRSQTDTDTLPPSKNEVNDESIALDANTKDNVERHGDIEEGNKDFVEERDGMAQDCNSTAVEYTHISLPLPGCDVKGINICSMVADNNRVRQADGEATGPTTNVSKKWKLTSLFRNEDDAVEKQTEPDAKRCVPIFCAICLSEYVKCDRVCWSSNAECSHVFHEDCILQWLISLGKKKSMSQLFTRHPTDLKLLQYQFCPCCRQDFISVKPALSGSEESV